MNTKTLFLVRLPATDKSFELWLPHELSVSKSAKFVATLLEEKEKRFFKSSSTSTLYLASDGVELDANKFIGEYLFINGTELVLI